jgi:hypothetical protein
MMRALIVVRTVKTYMSVASTVIAGVSEMSEQYTDEVPLERVRTPEL